jgi:predicted molibdopterin-dependent oxidoreductase YjgC
VDNAARLCHAPSTAAMKHAVGVAATTCSYKDWYGTDLVIFFGANPANDQPVTTKYLHEAKALGTKIVMVNPYREPGMERYWVPSNPASAVFGTDITDYWFPVSTGGDIAFLGGVMKICCQRWWTKLYREHCWLDELIGRRGTWLCSRGLPSQTMANLRVDPRRENAVLSGAWASRNTPLEAMRCP